MTRENEAIDWSAPIEAYHPDGRVVEVERAYGWCIRKHLSVDDARNWSFREDGTHGNSEWRIRNREPAQQWGDPIEVNGERPVWLGDDDLLQFQTIGNRHGKWLPDEGICGGRKWRNSAWTSVQRIRLTADHWAYEALRRGMVPWAGGDEAPDDWDGGEVLLRDNATSDSIDDWGREVSEDDRDIIGYKRRSLEPAPEGAPLSPDLVDRMVQLVREFAGDDYDHNFGPIWSDVRNIAAELPPEPIDPVVARAREIVAEALERQGGETNARPFRAGDRDDSPAMRAVIRALREGMGE